MIGQHCHLKLIYIELQSDRVQLHPLCNEGCGYDARLAQPGQMTLMHASLSHKLVDP